MDDLTGVVKEKSGVNNGTAGIATAAGDLTGTYVVQNNMAKTYGRFTINSDGTWSYTLDDTKSAVQALNVGGTLHELVTVKTTRGTNTIIDITIQGANDSAVITGTSARSVTEKSGVNNGTAGTATATGDLNATDVDSATTFTVQSSVAKTYGTFSIASNGNWTYTLDDNNASVQALNTGGTLHDLITVTTADGTAKVIDITINGANDSAVIGGTITGSVTEKSGVANGTAGVAAATGALSVTDVDNAATFVMQTNASKSYGTFSINAAGAWTYTLDDSDNAVQALNTGGTLHELVTVKSLDNTSKVIDITIKGANDAAVITGTATDSVSEKSGINNGTAGNAAASGDLDATDPDSATTFVVQSNVTKTYGTFSITTAGAWTYTLNDNNASVQALNVGGTLHELVTVATADGTTKVIDITINGANDAATITGTTTGSVTEKSGVANGTAGVATASGTLSATDIDSATTFTVQSSVAKTYGTFSIDSAGAWTYTLNDSNASVQALNTGGTLHDIFTAASVDGTTKSIDITIHGANDTATFGGTDTGSVTEKGGFGNSIPGVATASGTVTVTDPDNPLTFVAQSGVAKTYGTFTINTAGAWSYTLNDSNAAVQALNDGDTLHELVTVASADGTTKVIDITINGADDSGADLTHLTTALGFIIQGDLAGDNAGFAVASAGDVNGDGFTDLIVGARYGDDGGSKAGEAYVVFGKASGFGSTVSGRSVIDLTSLSAANGFIIRGDTAGDQAGWSVASAGDLNGDGFADLVVGAPYGDDGGSAAGEAYVVFGKSTGFGTASGGRQVIDLTSLAVADGFIVQGDVAGDQAGWSVSSAGDLNGDGFADLIVGARYGDDGGTDAGESYVVFGKASGFGSTVSSRQVLDLTNLSTTAGFIIQGDKLGDGEGASVSSAGDLNGDGYDDLVVGAFNGDDGGSDAGEAYVVFGKATGFGTAVGARSVIDLTSLSAANGFIVRGDVAGDNAGRSVSSAGDINGDGFGDLIIGAPGGDDGGNYAGEAYVVFGKASGFGTAVGARSVIDLTKLASGEGFILHSNVAWDAVGWSVASAGDFNGDGFGDLIVGTPYASGTNLYSGEAYVIFGKASGFGTLDSRNRPVIHLENLDMADGFLIQGDGDDDLAGNSVAAAGDVNGDGFADLIVGAPYGSDGGTEAGEGYVMFGGSFGGSTTPVTMTGTAAAEILIGGLGNDTLTGGGGADSIRGGAGDDLLTVSNLAFRSVDGGGGDDTLALLGAGQNFNFTTLANNKISGIETVDITGSGNNNITLGFADIVSINDGDNAAFTLVGTSHGLVVAGNAGDTCTLQSYDPDGAGGIAAALWTQAASNVGLDGTPGGGYNIYDLMRGSTAIALVAMDMDISKI